MIAVLTDFGVTDNYNGVVVATIKKLNPYANVEFITPQSKNFNVIAAAYQLYTSFKYFPRKTIFTVVVDPGVGTSRKAIIVKTKNYYFVGPDNGVLSWAANHDKIVEIRNFTNSNLYLSHSISNTFHGRDIFAVASAFLSLGLSMEIFGEKLTKIEKIPFQYSKEKNKHLGRVVFIDHFGNVATNIPFSVVNHISRVLIKDNEVKVKQVKSFGYAGRGELLVYENGYGFLEIGLREDSAANVLNVKEGDEICIEEYTQEDFSHFI
ncbi:hypothetical protein HS7_07880 [Sulfolobales archaeon HS-7]|nr:hypothetical protein HS7_07880 [Sulfolobales archaeon HS-7]